MFNVLKIVYFAFKATVIIGLVVGIGISQQCNDQLVEVCQMADGCNY